MKDDVLAREVRRFAFPAIAHSLLQTLVFVVDRIILGHYSETALAAMQLAGPIEWSIWSIFSAFTIGTISRVGWLVGARDTNGARHAVSASFVCTLIAGVLVAALSPWILTAVVKFAPAASQPSVDEVRAYLQVTLLASPLVFAATTATAALQAGGDTRTPLAIGIAVNALHIVLDKWWVLGGFGVAAMGARGAALGTAVTFACQALLGIAFLVKRNAVALELKKQALLAEIRRISHIAWPVVAERALYHTGFLAFVWMIALLGDDSMAANQAVVSVESACWLSAEGFGVAAAALVAQKLGASKHEEAERVIRISVGYAVTLLTTVGVLFFIGKGLILPLFSSDARVIAIGLTAVPIVVIAQPFMATAAVIADALRGAGLTRNVLFVTTVCALGVRLPATWLFSHVLGLGLAGVWMGSTSDWIMRTLVFAVAARFYAAKIRKT